MKAVLACLALAGCIGKDVATLDIPCMTDDECPTDEWCNIPFKSCQGRVAPPHLTFDDIPASGRVAITAKTHSFTSFKLTAHNDGGGQVELHITADGPKCLDASAGREDAGFLDAGKAVDFDLDVFPDPGCPSPSSFTVTVDASGRKFAVPYDVTITP